MGSVAEGFWPRHQRKHQTQQQPRRGHGAPAPPPMWNQRVLQQNHETTVSLLHLWITCVQQLQLYPEYRWGWSGASSSQTWRPRTVWWCRALAPEPWNLSLCPRRPHLTARTETHSSNIKPDQGYLTKLIPHTSYYPGVARVVKHPFSGCCLSSINVSHNANVSDSAGAIRQINTEPRRQWNGETGVIIQNILGYIRVDHSTQWFDIICKAEEKLRDSEILCMSIWFNSQRPHLIINWSIKQEWGNSSLTSFPLFGCCCFFFIKSTINKLLMDPIDQQTWKKAVVSSGITAHFASAAA